MRLRRSIRLVRDHWRDLLAAQFAVLEAHRAVRSCETGLLSPPSPEGEPADHGSSPPGGELVSAAQRTRAERLAWAVDVISRWGVARAECLVRALALSKLLRDRGLPAGRIRIGVRRGEREVEAHAWIEWAGGVLGDDPEAVASFRAFDRLDVMVRAGPGAKGRPGP